MRGLAVCPIPSSAPRPHSEAKPIAPNPSLAPGGKEIPGGLFQGPRWATGPGDQGVGDRNHFSSGPPALQSSG